MPALLTGLKVILRSLRISTVTLPISVPAEDWNLPNCDLRGRTLSVLVTPTPYCPAFLPFSLHLMFPLSTSTHLSVTETKLSNLRRESEKTKLTSLVVCFQDQVLGQPTGTTVAQRTSSLL